MSGRIGVAPCGHRGEHLTTNYVRCLQGCDTLATAPATPTDGVPEAVDREITEEIVRARECPSCTSTNVVFYPGLWVTGEDMLYCNSCGSRHKVASP